MPYRRETNVEYIIDTCTRIHILVFYGYNNLVKHVPVLSNDFIYFNYQINPEYSIRAYIHISTFYKVQTIHT
jgi:hypothetical protein